MAVLILLVGIASFFLLLRQYPIGVDSYNYLSYIWGNDDLSGTHNQSFLIPIFFGLFPKSLLFWTITSIVVAFSTSFVIGKIGEQFNKESGFWAAPLCWLGLAYQSYLLELEPMSFGILFGMISCYFFLKNKNKVNLKSLFFLVIAGLFWKGAIFFGLAFALFDLWLIVPIGLILLFNYGFLLGIVNPVQGVAENKSLSGLLIVFFYFFRFWGSSSKNFFDWKKWFDFSIKKEFSWFIAIWVLLGIISIKFVALAIPFLSLNLVQKFDNSFAYFVVALVCLYAVIGSAYFYYSSTHPTKADIDAVQKAISMDKNVRNDWSLGHYISFFGGIPSNRYGPSNSDNVFLCDERPVLTIQDLNWPFRRVWDNNVYSIYLCKMEGANLEP